MGGVSSSRSYAPARSSASLLWPPDARRGPLDCQDLSRSRPRNFGDVLHATPLSRYHEQRSAVHAPEHAGETAAVKVDCLQHLTAFADAHAALVGNVSVPNSVLLVDADAVGNAAAEVGPHPPVRQVAVCSDVEGGQSLPMGFG